MAHSVISGVGGAIDGVPTVRKWTLSASAATIRWLASGSEQGASRVAGPRDWSATYEAYGPLPAKMPGDEFTFTGSYDGTNGFVAPGMVDSVAINWNQETGDPITHTVAFSSNGALAPGAAAATDVTVPEAPPSVGCIIEVSDPLASPSFSEIEDVRSVTLTISRENKPYVSSSTVADGEARTKRTAGPWDMSLSYSVFEGDSALLFEPNVVKHFRIYVDDTLYWDLQWVRIGELSDIECDHETGELVGATQNGEMEGVTDVEDTQTVGAIKTPEAAPTTIWPVP